MKSLIKVLALNEVIIINIVYGLWIYGRLGSDCRGLDE